MNSGELGFPWKRFCELRPNFLGTSVFHINGILILISPMVDITVESLILFREKKFIFQTELNYIENCNWNFASCLGIRFFK
jgi:hypothetical protein